MIYSFERTLEIAGSAIASTARRSLSFHDAQDLVARVMVMIRDECGYTWFNNDDHCKAFWIKRTSMRATDFVRKMMRHERHEVILDMSPDSDESFDACDPADFIELTDSNMDLETMVSILTPYEKNILTLSYSGYSMDEIGTKLSCSKATISRHLKHIMERLECFRRLECEGSEWLKLTPEDVMGDTIELVEKNNQVGVFRNKSLLARGVVDKGTLLPVSLTTLGSSLGNPNEFKHAIEHMLKSKLTGLEQDRFLTIMKKAPVDRSTPIIGELLLGQIWGKDTLSYLVTEIDDENQESPTFGKCKLVGFSSNILGLATKDWYSFNDLMVRGFVVRRMSTQTEIDLVIKHEMLRAQGQPVKKTSPQSTVGPKSTENCGTEGEANMAKIKITPKKDVTEQEGDKGVQTPNPESAQPHAKSARKPKPKANPDLAPRAPLDLASITEVPDNVDDWKKVCGGDGYCMGGSGQPVAQRFRPGYDAKLKGLLRRLSTDNAKALAKELGWFDKINWIVDKAE